MNYKLLFPTYRNRYRFIKDNLKKFGENKKFGKALNLGTGEGDYDPMIAPYCYELVSCDINDQDVKFAQALNQGIPNIEYRVENALEMTFPDNYFDLIISVDVIEHVGRPARMIEEIQRVLKPDGVAMITFPSLEFPFTYDPINRFLSYFSTRKIPAGAYAFGHEYLISKNDFTYWSEKNSLKVVNEKNLSGYIIAFLEMYWTGIIQRIFKSNSKNVSEGEKKGLNLRPSLKEPGLTKLTDLIINFDHFLFKKTGASVGKGFVIQKRT